MLTIGSALMAKRRCGSVVRTFAMGCQRAPRVLSTDSVFAPFECGYPLARQRYFLDECRRRSSLQQCAELDLPNLLGSGLSK